MTEGQITAADFLAKLSAEGGFKHFSDNETKIKELVATTVDKLMEIDGGRGTLSNFILLQIIEKVYEKLKASSPEESLAWIVMLAHETQKWASIHLDINESKNKNREDLN